jgi:hypothetical protein
MSAVGATVVRVMGSGTLKDIGKLENINRLYKPGDIGEMQLFLGQNATDKGEVDKAARELESSLRKEGMKPWPNRRDIVTVDWPAKTVRLLFEAVAAPSGSGVRGVPQPVGIIPVIGLGAVLGVMMLASRVAFGISALLVVLSKLGLPIPDRVSRIADAVLLITSMGFAFKALRASRFARFIPRRFLPVLLGGGLLIFVLLKPGAAWKALKYVVKKAAEAAAAIFPMELLIPVVAVGGLLAFMLVRRR